jgi:hypothetical protein
VKDKPPVSDPNAPIDIIGTEPKIDELEPGQAIVYCRFEVYLNDPKMPIAQRQTERWGSVAGIVENEKIAEKFIMESGKWLTSLLDGLQVAVRQRKDASGQAIYLDDGTRIKVPPATDA